MSATTTHPAAAPPTGRTRRLLHRLSALAYAAADRLTSPYRDMPPDSYRFPPF